MKRVSISLMFMTFVLSSCFVNKSIQLSDDLRKNTSCFGVKWKYHFPFKNSITYGGYNTSAFTKGWSKESGVNLGIDVSHASQKFSFTQDAPGGISGNVDVVNKCSSIRKDFLNGFLQLPLKKDVNLCAGTIAIKNNGNEWRFYVDFSRNDNDLFTGEASDRSHNEIEIREARNFMDSSTGLLTVGFELRNNDKVISTVQTIDKPGKVWIRNDISPEMKLVAASIMTALLVGDDLEQGISVFH